MLPLTHKDSPSIIIRLKEKILGWKRIIWSEKTSRNIFLFLLLNFSFAIVEFMYGMWTNSLSLITDSFHMFFDCTGLISGLIASVITKWRATERYSYGYVRADILSGMINALTLFYVAFFLMTSAVERLYEPPEVKHERLFIVSVLGLIVNIIGICAFNHGHAGDCGHGHSHGHSHNHNHQHSHLSGGHGHSHNHNDHAHNHHGHMHNHQDNDIEHSHVGSSNSLITRGVYLHILTDALGSVGVIISAILMQMFGWMIADPICSLFIAILIFINVFPLLKESTIILMQRQPKALDNVLPQCYSRVTQMPGVYSVQEPHFWTLCTNIYVGCLKLEVARTVDPKYVVAQTQMIFQAVGVKQLTVQLDYSSS